MVQATFQQAAVYCLDRVKEIVGRNKFDHYLETFHPIIKKVISIQILNKLSEYCIYISNKIQKVSIVIDNHKYLNTSIYKQYYNIFTYKTPIHINTKHK